MMKTTYTSTKLKEYRHVFLTKGGQREAMMIISAIRLIDTKSQKIKENLN